MELFTLDIKGNFMNINAIAHCEWTIRSVYMYHKSNQPVCCLSNVTIAAFCVVNIYTQPLRDTDMLIPQTHVHKTSNKPTIRNIRLQFNVCNASFTPNESESESLTLLSVNS